MIFSATEKNIAKAAAMIHQGELVAFPTETVYGLGADAFNALACAKIFEIKQRPFFDPLIVHVEGIEQAKKVAFFDDSRVMNLAKKFWPGPLSLVVRKNPDLPEIVTSGLETVAVRMPDHDVALNLIKQARTPIAAPSANLFNYLSPTKAEHVEEQFGEKISMILDGGSCEFGVESTIIDFSQNQPRVLRFGGLAIEEIEKVIGPVGFENNTKENPKAPGQLIKHYSPRTKLRIIDLKTKEFPVGRIGLLAFKKPQNHDGFAVVEILSLGGDLKQAAANLFGALHRLDKQNLDLILAESVPEIGLGRAIMERLRKASA